MTCPAPIGTVPKEDCAEIADDFGALTVEGALKVTGAGKEAEQKAEAIRAVAMLAASIKEQRVKLCDAYVKCKVPLAEHDTQDKLLAGAMRSLIDAWNKRRFSGLDEVMRFREQVRSIDRRVNGGAETPPPPPKPPRTVKAADVLDRIEDPGVAFRVLDAGALGVSATAEGKRDAIRSKPDALALASGHRYRLKVSGSYKPASASLVAPGDEIVARLKYRALGAADLSFGLRSLEDPEGGEADAFHINAGEKGGREIKLVADPQQTGHYVGVAVKGGQVELDELELVRGGKVVVAAHAEGGDEPGVKTDCAPSKDKPIAGKQSLRCQPGDGDRVTLGKPESYLVIALRDSTGVRATTRSLSLEGDRSVDASVNEGGELLITLVGAGTATLERIEITDLGM
jgi:hypothetical protein